jgi:hypothetical protein
LPFSKKILLQKCGGNGMGERKGADPDEELAFGWTIPEPGSSEDEVETEEERLVAELDAARVDFLTRVAPEMNERQRALEAMRYGPAQMKVRAERGSLDLVYSHDPKDQELQERYRAAVERLAAAYEALEKYRNKKRKKE